MPSSFSHVASRRLALGGGAIPFYLTTLHAFTTHCAMAIGGQRLRHLTCSPRADEAAATVFLTHEDAPQRWGHGWVSVICSLQVQCRLDSSNFVHSAM
ncbi:hypothetical protein N431DRAFT_427759 [Stipitochalara longipes BDJ]|nr:hypothetical protein N431DRAFT_427759 [Stipitochalara longipes BDJ]